MRNKLLLVFLLSALMAIVGWQMVDQLDLLQQQQIDNLHSRLLTVEAREGIEATAYPFPTPTQEVNIIRQAQNGNQFVRTLRARPDLSGNQVGTLDKGAFIWLCLDVDPIASDGYIWHRAYYPSIGVVWVSVSKGNTKYVTLLDVYDSGLAAGCE